MNLARMYQNDFKFENFFIEIFLFHQAIAAAVVNFPNIKAAVDTVVTTLGCSMPLARIELLDEVTVKACNSYSNLSLKEKPTLFLEFHSSEVGMDYQTSTVNEIAKENGGSNFEYAIRYVHNQLLLN